MKKNKLPFVTAKCAQTLDGKIATSTGSSQWITSARTRQWARAERKKFDAILVGIETVLKDDPRLNAQGRSTPIKKVVLDSRLRIPFKARLFHRVDPQNCILATTKKAGAKKIQTLRTKGMVVLICPTRDGKIKMDFVLKSLYELGVHSVLIEGGAKVIGSALKEKVVDQMKIYLAPKLLGDETALSSIAGRRVASINQCLSLRNIKLKRMGPDFLIEGEVVY